MSDNKMLIRNLNERWSKLSAEEILQQASVEFGSNMVFASSMGAEDQVITHLIAKNGFPINIITLDTGRTFPENFDLIHRTNARYNNRVKIIFPDAEEVEEMVNSKGINLFYESVENRKTCCKVRKINPLNKILSTRDAWVTGLRKSQSITRDDIKTVEWDSSFNLVKINPLLSWSEAEIWDFINEHNVPFNVLHKQGYASIGCQPCTRPINPGEDIRAGRWWWENPETKECGLHYKQIKP